MEAAITLGFGLVAVVIGLAVFMEGLSTGLMPFGNIIGDNLPKKASMFVVLLIIGILGVGVTFAEPAIGALQAFGASVDVNKAPYLYEILNNWTLPLVLMVGGGVGLAAILGTIRFVRGWSLKPMIYAALFPVVLLTVYHFYLGKTLNQFKLDQNKHSHKFFRVINEIPTILLILIVFVVIFKPL